MDFPARRRSIPIVLLTVVLSVSCLLPTWADAPKRAFEEEIAKLKKENEALRSENQRLRRMLAEPVTEKVVNTKNGAPDVSQKPGVRQNKEVETAKDAKYWLSASGKRHNERCRYFRSATGSPCGASDGTACKVCGG